ncbi:hypothetical protein SEA_GERALDINI_41 [Mycobacterium phage Geraldini]|nr:hypothetical protein SEA_GERALDINI_41 [Mycobacterium phage Geraldini]
MKWALRWRRRIVECDKWRGWARACDCASCEAKRDTGELALFELDAAA